VQRRGASLPAAQLLVGAVTCLHAQRALLFNVGGLTDICLSLNCPLPWLHMQAVPYEMSLAAIKKYIWRKPDDVMFVYRVRDPAAPAQLPSITHTPSS
jgi:hypothetical protein